MSEPSTIRPPSGCAVTIDQVSKRYGSNTVLKSINMAIKPGEFFTLLGPSGCGKTTLLRALAGFHGIDEGRILFNGQDVSRTQPWDRNIGFVFQNYALWPNKTVFDNVAYGLRIRNVPKAEIARRVRDALERVELRNVEARFPGEMSGGMQQRIALARALVIDPPLLLLDEPMSNLDAKLRVSLRRQLRDIQEALGVTAIYVTHDQEEALELSDRVAVMQGGIVQQLGKPEDIYASPSNRFVAEFVGAANLVDGVLREGRFELKGGGRIEVPDAQTDGPATLFVRPEGLRLVDPHVAGVLPGHVASARYVGRAWVHEVQVSDDEILIVDVATRIPNGTPVGLAINAPRFLRAS
ncbi:ABC transporter ATP-binding protein [Microvirga lotononidis]|uniref:ABC-type spermidine/putrescine transport system, ATPase component n=1 Tax=Microvirga lotononidis TaxID=864069 RepID=I4YRM4_9HYPH|nr:ABC transporter ATP-binding protein [Microvirga lotononidis]EIM26616.1 ABC-type spermidine/putrescine transport system, ATPase component [Microvirga lotononidis]WQO31291.1 ABC transporter ATP-binding protein [Microvirga lotononidis]